MSCRGLCDEKRSVRLIEDLYRPFLSSKYTVVRSTVCVTFQNSLLHFLECKEVIKQGLKSLFMHTTEHNIMSAFKERLYLYGYLISRLSLTAGFSLHL